MTHKPSPLPHITLTSAGELIQEFNWMRKHDRVPIRIIHKLAQMLYEENLVLKLKIAELEGEDGQKSWKSRVNKNAK